MKIIVQFLPDEFEKILLNVSDDQMNLYEVDKETYDYFLSEIFEKNFEAFVKQKTGKKQKKIIGFDPDSNDKAKKFEAMFEWHRKTKKYLKEFHKKREKFYLYKGSVYSYTLIGYENVGHIIEIIKYENDELIEILNKSI